MKMYEIDCDGGCPFKEEELCNMGPPCFYDPPCAIYGDDERDVKDIIDEIFERRRQADEAEDRRCRMEQEKAKRNAETAKKRREVNWVTREERNAIKTLKKKIEGCEGAIRLASSFRELNAVLGGGLDKDLPPSEYEQELRLEIEVYRKEIEKQEAKKKEKLKALKEKRRTLQTS